MPSTPPEELAAASSVGDRCTLAAAVTCSAPNSELEEVSEPVTATPSQPRIGDRNAKNPPAPAIHSPRVWVSPLLFITNDRPRTAITVTIAHLSWSRVRP